MPRVAVAVIDLTKAGIIIGGTGTVEVAGNAADNHYFAGGGGGDIIPIIRNAGAGARTWTPVKNKYVDGDLATSTARSIAAGVTKAFAPLPPGDYLQADGTINVDVEHAEVKVIFLRVPRVG